jgi:hypothetical protein
MAEQIEVCPYCMPGDQNRPMLQRPGWFICEQCGHAAMPDDPDFRCSCSNCSRVKRAA